MIPRALVLDANQRSSLAAIRSLGRTGMDVVAADSTTYTLGGASRYAKKRMIYPDPTANSAAFIEAIAKAIITHQIDIIFPMTDVTTMLLVHNRERFTPALLACASAESYEMLTDKAQLIQLAQNLNIPVPDTVIARTPDAILTASDAMGFPVVLKPSRSKYLKNGRIYSTQVRIVNTRSDIQRLLEHLPWLNDIPCLVQRYIPGYGAGIFILANGTQVIARFAHQRLREKPPSGGVSVLCESVPVNPLLADLSDRLLFSAHWSGPAMIEYRIGTDGRPYLMEINGRFWGSLQLSVDCGVDFPSLLYRLFKNKQPELSTKYHTGKRLRWLLGDLDNLILQLRAKNLSFNSRKKAINNFFATFFDRRCRQEIFRWSDPFPSVYELGAWIKAIL